MALSSSPPAGTFPDDDQVQNQRRARRLLSRMERMEEHAQKSLGEVPLSDEGLKDNEIAIYQGMFENTYRRLVGVAPAQREELRHELEEVQVCGHRTVEQVIESVRTRIDTQRILEPHLGEGL